MKTFSPSPELLGILNDEVRSGIGSATLLSVLKPILERRTEQLLSLLEQCEPDLSKLLDLRAKISAVRAMSRELDQAAKKGQEAGEQLSKVV